MKIEIVKEIGNDDTIFYSVEVNGEYQNNSSIYGGTVSSPYDDGLKRVTKIYNLIKSRLINHTSVKETILSEEIPSK